MRILIATDKFKDALDAPAAAAAIAEGLAAALPAVKVMQLPLSDGGDGFARLVASYAGSGAKLISAEVNGPLQQPLLAHFTWLPRNKRVYIEMAEAAGLQLVPQAMRSPLHTTTFGVGELIKRAIGLGAEEVYLGIGGSATHDLGVGMAAALGYHFLDKEGRPFLPTGGSLLQVDRISRSHVLPALDKLKMVVACDVTNPLYGPTGAANTYARQKGATDDQLALLESGSKWVHTLIERDLGRTVALVPGSGAAGGLGAGAMAFLGAELMPGARMILELAGFSRKVAEADLVIAGEGKADAQSLQGKVLGEIAVQSAQARKPLLLLCGKLALSTQQLYKANIWHAVPLSPPGEDLELSLRLCKARLSASAKQALLFYLNQTKKPR